MDKMLVIFGTLMIVTGGLNLTIVFERRTPFQETIPNLVVGILITGFGVIAVVVA